MVFVFIEMKPKTKFIMYNIIIIVAMDAFSTKSNYAKKKTLIEISAATV